MEQQNKSSLKIRCSALGNVMTNGRGKNSGMGLTAQTYLRELWIKNKFGREKILHTKEMQKGIECEADSVTLASNVSDRMMLKNTKHFENQFLTGTPDVILDNLVIDLKTSWDIWTFAKADLSKVYEWQLRGYMMLIGAEKAELSYCLVNTPGDMVSDALYKMHFNYPDGDDNPQYQIDADQVEKNMKFDDIPPQQRVKTFYIERNKDIENDIMNRVIEAREFYNNITL